MATSQVNGWADELLSGLTTNAKAYRLANITKRQSEMKQSSRQTLAIPTTRSGMESSCIN